MSAEQELRTTLERVSSALEAVRVQWAIGGSFASTVYGEPRATNDIDVVASLRFAHVADFVAASAAQGLHGRTPPAV
jgi:hypothetical protein